MVIDELKNGTLIQYLDIMPLMKKLLPHLLILLLVVGCASRSNVKTTNITMTLVDGKINSGTTTLKIEDIIKDCKKECATFTISSDEWCNCMNQCSQDVFDKNNISFGDLETSVYIKECQSWWHSDKDSN